MQRQYKLLGLLLLITLVALGCSKSGETVPANAVAQEKQELVTLRKLTKAAIMTEKLSNVIAYGNYVQGRVQTEDGFLELVFSDSSVRYGGVAEPSFFRITKYNPKGELLWMISDYNRDGTVNWANDYDTDGSTVFDEASNIGLGQKDYWQKLYDEIIPEVTKKLQPQ